MLIDDQEQPLLRKMSAKDSVFYQALSLFGLRMVYANVSLDLTVPFSTAAILPYNPFSTGERQVNISSTYHNVVEGEEETDECITEPNAPVEECTPLNDKDELVILENDKSEEVPPKQHEDGDQQNPTSDAPDACEGNAEQVVGQDLSDELLCEKGEQQATEEAEEERMFCKDARAPILREMYESLNSLQWKRVYVKLADLSPHETIVAKRRWYLPSVSQKAAGIMAHLTDHFSL